MSEKFGVDFIARCMAAEALEKSEEGVTYEAGENITFTEDSSTGATVINAADAPELIAGSNITLSEDSSTGAITISAQVGPGTGVGEWIEPGTQYTYQETTYTVGTNVERFNLYGDDGDIVNQAAGDYSHVEGFSNKALGTHSHAEGSGNITIGNWSHVEGSANVVKGEYGHAEGSTNTVNASCSHAEGYSNDVYGQNAHVEGGDCLVAGAYGHGEGYNTTSTGQSAHAEGDHSLAEGQSSHAEGTSYAYGERSHAEGYSVKSTSGAIGYASHSEGYNCTANGSSSHAEGQETTTNGLYSHAEGYGTKAQANYSHAQNQYTEARAEASTAMGSHTIASAKSQLVLGEYNVSNSDIVNKTGVSGYDYTLAKYPFIIGNGYEDNSFTETEHRSDAFKVDSDGKIYVGADTNGVDVKALNDSFAVSSSDDGKILTASYSGGVGTYSWVSPQAYSQVQADWTQTDNTAVDYIKNKPNLATVATSGSYNDLSNKPTIPAAQVNADWNSSSGVSEILNKPNLATVATSGSYNDLSNKPTIPAAQVQSDWNAVSGMGEILNKPTLGSAAAANTTDFATAAQGAKADTALQSSDLNGYATQTWVGQQGYLTSADEVPAVTSSDDGKVLTASYSGGSGTYNWTAVPTPANMEVTTNKVTSLSAASTDTQYPSAKCVYDLIGDVQTILATLTTP